MMQLMPTHLSNVMSSLTLAAASPADHVYNHVFIKNAAGFWLWSGNQGNLILSAFICILVGWWAAKKIGNGPDDMTRVRKQGDDKSLDTGVGLCGEQRQLTAQHHTGANPGEPPAIVAVGPGILAAHLPQVVPRARQPGVGPQRADRGHHQHGHEAEHGDDHDEVGEHEPAYACNPIGL